MMLAARLGFATAGPVALLKHGLAMQASPIFCRWHGWAPATIGSCRQRQRLGNASVPAACESLAGAFVALTARRHQSQIAAECSQSAIGSERHPVTGLPPGPYPVGVTTVQFDDHSRRDPDGGPRCLQTEIWYPATEEARSLPPNRYSDFLSRGALPEFIERAQDADAIGGYREGLTIAELDRTWQNLGRRDAQVRAPATGEAWPAVLFSHGSGAFRANYVYFTEFLASQGFVVAACDHVGNSRYTILNGKVVKAGGPRLDASREDRPRDMLFLLDSLEKMNLGADSRFAGRLDTNNSAVTGMSFGGWAAAKVVDMGDPRVKAAVLLCPWLACGALDKPVRMPALTMLGTEDTVIGSAGNEMCREYFARALGPRYLLEIKAGGHASFTSREQYNASHGNGIGPSRSLTAPGTTYEPLPPEEAHAAVNAYALAFLDVHLRGQLDQEKLLEKNHFEGSILYDFVH